MVYEQLLMEVENNGIEVKETPFSSARIKGLYVDNTITINSQLETSVEKTCILAEEIGHHYTSCGNILDQSKIENRKQERRARAYAYEKLVSLEKLIDALEHGVKNCFELAEFLNVTEEFVAEAIAYYKAKYWPYYKIRGYYITFEPLAVLKEIS